MRGSLGPALSWRSLSPTWIAIAALLVGGCASSRPRGTTTLGQRHNTTAATDLGNLAAPNTERWAGYAWKGRVVAVGSSWTVPRILNGSPAGMAATWIGALTDADPPWFRRASVARRVSYQPPFIQVGTNEGLVAANGRRHTVYYAFWTDTVHRFLPITLFTVRPGDDIEATLSHRRGRWTVSISDKTSRRRRQLSTTDEAKRAPDTAQWIQERLVRLSAEHTTGYAST